MLITLSILALAQLAITIVFWATVLTDREEISKTSLFVLSGMAVAQSVIAIIAMAVR